MVTLSSFIDIAMLEGAATLSSFSLTILVPLLPLDGADTVAIKLGWGGGGGGGGGPTIVGGAGGGGGGGGGIPS